MQLNSKDAVSKSPFTNELSSRVALIRSPVRIVNHSSVLYFLDPEMSQVLVAFLTSVIQIASFFEKVM